MIGEFWQSKYNKEDQIKDFFVTMKRPFRIKRTAYSSMFDNGKRKLFFSNGRLWGKHLGMITQLKSYVRKNVVNIEKFQYSKVYDYNEEKFNTTQGKILSILEYDLSSAYVTCAKKMQYISDEIANKILKQKKTFRLKILGSLGTKRNVIECDKFGNILSSKIENDIFLTEVWRSIVSRVNADIIMQCQRDNLWAMFWVDNYWTNCTDVSNILFSKQGYGFRVSETDIVYRKTANSISMYLPDQRFFTMPLKRDYMTSKVAYDTWLHRPEEYPVNESNIKYKNGVFTHE